MCAANSGRIPNAFAISATRCLCLESLLLAQRELETGTLVAPLGLDGLKVNGYTLNLLKSRADLPQAEKLSGLAIRGAWGGLKRLPGFFAQSNAIPLLAVVPTEYLTSRASPH
ncbi:hypothetical protein [Paraburkholderia youngii]|uniref:hypothetical protein n=1 Tax=Paraburkholderia youngii TaxID=2782701 RepID=UPI003D1D2468